MAVEIKMKNSSNSEAAFFAKVLPPNSPALKKVQSLIALGFNFSVGFYSVNAVGPGGSGESYTVTLPTSTTTLLKAGPYDSGTPSVALAREKLMEWIIGVSLLHPTTAKPAEDGAGNTAPTAQVIPLKDAFALGQKVYGSSKGVVYYAVAVSESLKVACRIIGTKKISFRVEGEDLKLTGIQKILKANGMKEGAGYWSVHIDPSGVPVARVIGAFLMGLGIPFTHQINNSGLATKVVTE